jgi:hypothetical protein
VARRNGTFDVRSGHRKKRARLETFLHRTWVLLWRRNIFAKNLGLVFGSENFKSEDRLKISV